MVDQTEAQIVTKEEGGMPEISVVGFMEAGCSDEGHMEKWVSDGKLVWSEPRYTQQFEYWTRRPVSIKYSGA